MGGDSFEANRNFAIAVVPLEIAGAVIYWRCPETDSLVYFALGISGFVIFVLLCVFCSGTAAGKREEYDKTAFSGNAHTTQEDSAFREEVRILDTHKGGGKQDDANVTVGLTECAEKQCKGNQNEDPKNEK